MKSKILVALIACLALGACNSGSDKADDNKAPAEGIQGTSDTAAPDAHAASPQPLNPSAPTQPAAPAATPANPPAPGAAPAPEHHGLNEGTQQNLAAETSTTTIQQNPQDAAKTQLDVSVQAQGTPAGVTTTTTTTATPAASDDMHSHPED